MSSWPQNSVVFCLLIASLTTGGCAIADKSASIDSTSRMPYFTLGLMPKPRDPAPETTRIRRDGSIPLEPKPAKLVVKGSAKDAAWWPKLRGGEEKAPIKLPRTDLAETAPVTSKPTELPTSPAEPIEF